MKLINKALLVLSLLPFSNISFEQEIQLTKSNVLSVFNGSIRQDKKNKINVNSNPWVICNKDSSFYKSDTLVLYNNETYYYSSNCCDFVDWTFYKKRTFVLTEMKICKEPTTMSFAKSENWFKVEIESSAQVLFLNVINQEILVDKYKILSIRKEAIYGNGDGIANAITLVRVPLNIE